jgi:hypothetical protein
MSSVLAGGGDAVRTDDEQALVAEQQEIQQRLVRAVGKVPLGVANCARIPVFARRGERDLRELAAVEPARPVLAAIVGGEDHPAMADRPAMPRVGKPHGGQCRARRSRSLAPATTFVVRQHDEAALADRDDA